MVNAFHSDASSGHLNLVRSGSAYSGYLFRYAKPIKRGGCDMADLIHRVGIKASPDRVFRALKIDNWN